MVDSHSESISSLLKIQYIDKLKWLANLTFHHKKNFDKDLTAIAVVAQQTTIANVQLVV